MFYLSKYDSPIGELTMASNGTELVGLWIEGQKYFAANIPQNYVITDLLPVFKQTKHWLDIYFSGIVPDFTPPLEFVNVSPFRKRVLQILLTIAYGKTSTYGEIARRMQAETGKNVSAQAVGGAVGHNPISVIVPCHRVIGSDGNLTGYAGGIDKKIRLLKTEGAKI